MWMENSRSTARRSSLPWDVPIKNVVTRNAKNTHVEDALIAKGLGIVKENRTLWLCGWQIPSPVPVKSCKIYKAYDVTPQLRHLRRSGKLGIHWDAGPIAVDHFDKPRVTWCLRRSLRMSTPCSLLDSKAVRGTTLCLPCYMECTLVSTN